MNSDLTVLDFSGFYFPEVVSRGSFISQWNIHHCMCRSFFFYKVTVDQACGSSGDLLKMDSLNFSVSSEKHNITTVIKFS